MLAARIAPLGARAVLEAEVGPEMPTPASPLPCTTYLAFLKHAGLSLLPCCCSLSSHSPSLASNTDSKITSSTLSSMSCSGTMNTACCGPAILQICPLPTPSRGWDIRRYAPQNLAVFQNFQRFGYRAHSLIGTATATGLWTYTQEAAGSASAQLTTLLYGLGQITQSL